MIVCKLELWPGGSEEKAKHLGTIEISNTWVSTIQSKGRRGDYSYRIFKKLRTTRRAGRIHDFPRLSYHPWNLVREILNKEAERNNGRI